jgi:hypothetical protein
MRMCTRLRCQKCSCEVDVVDLIQPEVLAGIAEPTFHACAEINKRHFFEGPDETLFVCLGSVLKSM